MLSPPWAEWRLEADQREKAYAKRHILKREQLTAGSKALPPLKAGDNVAIQDSSKPGKPGKWTKTGIVTDCLPFHSYEIKIDGNNYLTKRNRVHLRKIIPFVTQTMLNEQRLRSQILPPHVITRSASSEPAPPAPEVPALPTVPVSPTPIPPPAASPSLPPTSPPAPQPSTPRPRIREKWILSNDKTLGSPSSPQPHSDLPASPPPDVPPPGVRHDYAALAEQAKALRNSIMSARNNVQASLST